jgi:hypothetical protein
MPTHEVEFYAELADRVNSPADIEKYRDDEVRRFYRCYVHPANWRLVLEKFPNLRLCLAHFGGNDEGKNAPDPDWAEEIIRLCADYPNVYTDLSCWPWKEQDVRWRLFKTIRNRDEYHLRRKILFGTDWYMTLLRRGAKKNRTEYDDYCRRCRKAIDNCEEPDDFFWLRFTLLNPFAFLGIGEKDGMTGRRARLDNIRSALLAADGALPNAVEAAYRRLLEICDEVDRLTEQVKPWDRKGA